MEQRLSLVTLGVRDMTRSRAFYEALGWTASPASEDGVTFFQCGGLIVGLFGFGDLAEDAGVPPATAGGTGISLAHNARSRDGVDTILAEAEAAGATIVKPAKDTVWGGYSGCFRDPDGHLWEVAWNPFFPIAGDGTVRLPD
ncbi:MAG: VOC family protein [Rhodospirillaceae bacterium]